MWVNKPTSDVEALLQAIQPFLQEYTVVRQSIRSYNDRGRVDNVRTVETIRACIQPNTKQLNTEQSGKGRQIKATYTLYLVVPEYVNLGDVIHTPYWGDLKVDSLDDQRYQGMQTAQLVRTSTTESSIAQDNRLYEPD